MDPPDLPRPARCDSSLRHRPGSRRAVTLVIERPRASAAPSPLERAGDVLTEEALGLVAELHQRFDRRRRDLLALRAERQEQGELPDFRADTKAIRDGDWRIGSIPADLMDRRVEITGPTNAKMI